MKTKKQPAQTHLFNDPDSAGSSALPATLRDDLRTLGLVYMEAHAAHAAQEAARSGTAHLAYLEALAAGESAAQHDRTVARRLALGIVNPSRDFTHLISDMEGRLRAGRILAQLRPMHLQPEAFWALAEGDEFGF